jgi:hypothetical protein
VADQPERDHRGEVDHPAGHAVVPDLDDAEQERRPQPGVGLAVAVAAQRGQAQADHEDDQEPGPQHRCQHQEQRRPGTALDQRAVVDGGERAAADHQRDGDRPAPHRHVVDEHRPPPPQDGDRPEDRHQAERRRDDAAGPQVRRGDGRACRRGVRGQPRGGGADDHQDGHRERDEPCDTARSPRFHARTIARRQAPLGRRPGGVSRS